MPDSQCVSRRNWTVFMHICFQFGALVMALTNCAQEFIKKFVNGLKCKSVFEGPIMFQKDFNSGTILPLR